MAPRRQLPDEAEAEADFHFNKRRHLLSSMFEGLSRASKIEEIVPMLEPIIRKCVREEVNQAIEPYVSRTLDTEAERPSSRPGSRNLWLQFDSKLPATLFTGNKIVSESTSCIKISLYDGGTRQRVRSGPFSSMKVEVVVVNGDFASEEWSKTEFESNVVQSREGKRPLVNGDRIVGLENGEGYVNEVYFTDNSSWIRSGKFRLGVRVHSGCDETLVREGISNAFKVKDHRGEAYQKLYPPNLDSEVWRLEKIAKGGAYHAQLSGLGISTVGDFLRLYAMNQTSLRAALHNISTKKWEKIIAHATTCTLDGRKYIYRDPGGIGTALVFDSVYRVIGVTFDAQTYHSVDGLNTYQKKMVEDLKQRAYGNLNNWEAFEGEVEALQETRHGGSLFELGQSSQIQGFNLTFSNSFGVADYMEQQLSPQDFKVDDDFEEN